MTQYQFPLLVRDDAGELWYFRDGKIRMIAAEIEAPNRTEREENGYRCDSLEDGIECLIDYGYLSNREVFYYDPASGFRKGL